MRVASVSSHYAQCIGSGQMTTDAVSYHIRRVQTQFEGFLGSEKAIFESGKMFEVNVLLGIIHKFSHFYVHNLCIIISIAYCNYP